MGGGRFFILCVMKILRISVLFFVLFVMSSVKGQTIISMAFEQNPLFTVSTNDVSATYDGTPLVLGADIVIAGGSGNYTYHWYTSSTELGTEPTLIVNEGGEYMLDISDECDCLQTVIFHIAGPSDVQQIAAEDVRQVVVFGESGVLMKVFNGPTADLSSLPSGVYIINKVSVDGRISTSKVYNK